MQSKIRALSKRIDDYRKKNLNEAATKSGLIEPLFRVFGWDFSDIDGVQPEYPVMLEGMNNPADYALKFDGKVRLFLEAKRINEKINVAIEDGTAKAIKEDVPWLIATNGDAVAVLMIDQNISEEENEVFNVSLSDALQGEQALNHFIRHMQLLAPEAIQSGDLQRFAEQKLKETRITNTIKNIINSGEFRGLIQETFSEIYPDDKVDQDILDKTIEKIRIGDRDEPSAIDKPVDDPDSPTYQDRRKKLFKYPSKKEQESIKNNIKDKETLWLEFIEKKRMPMQEFKDYAKFAKKGVSGFYAFLRHYGLAIPDGKDKVRGGIVLKINESIIAEIREILGVK
jgi:hypothetical protein